MPQHDPTHPATDGLPDPRLAPYTFDLPDHLVARFPATRRTDARLLVVQPGGLDLGGIDDLERLVRPGDLLVLNDTRVLRARVFARRATGGRVELLLLGGEGDTAEALVRPARRLREGERLRVTRGRGGRVCPDLELVLRSAPEGGCCEVVALPSLEAVMAEAGELPLPPYLGRAPVASDDERYQTVFARDPGAVAAPTAGLHLTRALLDRLEARGVEVASLTLHVGPGTFQPLRAEALDSGLLHTERFCLPPSTAAAVQATRARGGRVIAVGTTSTRALESAAQPDGSLRTGWQSTRLFVREGYGFEVVDALLTNFHLPCSSLLMLVCAFGGRDTVLAAYRRAVDLELRFYSYGDAMFLERAVAPIRLARELR